MSLSRTDVEHVAALARLGLDNDELERMRDQLSSILEHIAVLDQLDTGAISPTAQVNVLRNVLREDDVRPSLDQADILRNAPEARDGFLEVRSVMGAADDRETDA